MHLDVPTLMVMGSFVAGCCGAILLGAWLGNQRTATLGYWGLADLMMAGGVLLLMFGMVHGEPPLMSLGDVSLSLAAGLMWKGARTFAGKPSPPAIAFFGGLIVAAVGLFPAAQNFDAHLSLVLQAAYLSGAGYAFWSARKPPLPARWPLVAFIAAHAGVMLIGAVSLFNGAPSLVPPLMSLFGIIHFEAIVFAVGTTVLILAMVKERSEAASRHIASIDSLTGVANRAAFVSGAERALSRCRHDKVPVSVVMFDLDYFKGINDTHGHAVGDAVIQKFCEVAAKAIRHDDVFGRIGGEEFALVLPRSSIEPSHVRADRIRLEFAANCRVLRDHQVNATVSAGVSCSLDAEITLSVLLEQADEALYRAKAAGRNRVKRAGSPPPLPGSDVIRVA